MAYTKSLVFEHLLILSTELNIDLTLLPIILSLVKANPYDKQYAFIREKAQ